LSAITRAKNASGESKILLEKYIPKGKDIQVYIVDGKIVAAYERVPAHVVGNGKRSIKRLISKKNRRRKNNPGLAHYPINNIKLIEQNIEQEDHTLESVLEKDESVILKGKSNINLGGEPHDILDYLPKKVDQFVETLKQNTDKLPAFSFEFIQD